MNIEELEKEAEERYKEHLADPNYYESSEEESYLRGFQEGVEPREKRIAELEAQIEKMKCCSNCKFRNEFDDADVKSERCIGCCPENDNWEFGL